MKECESSVVKVMNRRIAYLALVFLLVPSSVLWAQVGTDGAILGMVTDSSGAVIVGAEVTASNLNTGLKKTAVTGTGGDFEIFALPVGPYSVSASSAGFKKWEIARTELTVGERKRVSPVLEVGEITEKVTVEAQAELVQTDKGSVETIVEEKAIRELPLNGRNPIGLVGLVPGMRVTGLGAGRHRQNTVQGLGARGDETTFQLDGLSSMETVSKTGIAFPNIETIAEFNVETSNFTAEHGGTPLQVLLVTKAGTNAFHGSAWEFIRNDKLDAKNTFAATKPKLRRNQFGAVFGGPIVKDKTHFFGSYEGTRIRQELLYNSVTPDAQMFQGNFSSLTRAIRDPLTGQPFSGNIIPADRITSASKFFFPYILQPNAPGNRFVGVAPSPDDAGLYSVRVDQQITPNHRFYGRLVLDRFKTAPPQGTPDVIIDFGVLQHNAMLSYTWSINPTTLLTASGGYVRTRALIGTNVGGIENLTHQAGLNGFNTSEETKCCTGLPTVSFTGYTGLFGNAFEAPGQQKFWTQNYKANMNFIRAAHSLSFGYEFFNSSFISGSSDCCTRGVFDFTGQYTGDGFADYLLGFPSSSRRSFPTATFGVHDSPYSGFYFQDFWKLTPNLTVNLGVRYEYWHEKSFVRGIGSTFDLERGVSVIGEDKNGRVDLTSQPISKYFAPATQGLWISASEAGLPPGLFVARGVPVPRLGIAWRPLGSNYLVVRGGYGIFPSIYNDNSNGSSIIAPPLLVNETQTWSPSQLQRWETAWDNSYSRFPTPDNISPLPDLANIKSHQWNVSIQKSMPANSAVTVSYVGNKVIDQNTRLEFNVPRPGQYTNLQAARPYPTYGRISLYDTYGYSRYDALQLKWERRFVSGFSYLLSYSFSKHIGDGEASLGDTPEPFSPEGHNRGRSQNDRTHLLAVNGVWEVPLGRGRKHLNNLHPVANGILGGWQFSSIYYFSSGAPLTFAVPGSTLGNGRGTRPNLGPNLKLSSPSADLWFSPQALTAPPPFTFGNSGVNILDGPGTHVWDTSLSKNFYVAESRFLQFRWEMFNAPNHVNLGNPVTNIGLPTTGRILSAGTARSMQFALKFVF